MTVDAAVDLVREALVAMLVLSAPILLAGLVIGLVISLLQAVTQIQEQTLSFVPKIVAMGLVSIFIAPWLVTQMLEFASRMFSGS
ncbi:MAG: flagellar biosynthesis protein FliQ [Phycisphaera sp.]|nr:flagellar biosynthesis protein FliQ [Phycisphaera sp.]